MTRVRSDGSIMSANAPVKPLSAKGRTDYSPILMRGMIFKVRYTDDPANDTKGSQNPQVTYDVIVNSGPYEGRIFSNVRAAPQIGGQYNYQEIIYRQASKPFSGQNAVPFNQQDGDVVYLEFTNGLLSAPVIVGSGKHPLDASNTGAAKADGPRWVQEYNGINQLIDKNGNFTLTRKGGKYDSAKDYFIPASSGSNQAKISMTGSGDDGILTISTGSLNVTIDSSKNKITIVAKSGTAEIDIDGSSGAITLSGQNVNIGQTASSLAVLGSELMSWLSSHTHGNGNNGSPTTAPSTPPPSSALSGTVKIQK